MSDYDMERMTTGKTTELEETLAWLADNTAMTLAVLSSSSLLDSNADKTAVSQTMLDEMIMRTGFKRVNLSNIMRSSQKIAAAASPASVDEMDTWNHAKIQLQACIHCKYYRRRAIKVQQNMYYLHCFVGCQ